MIGRRVLDGRGQGSSGQWSRRALARLNTMDEQTNSRRRFLKVVPVAVAGAVASRTLAQGQAPAGPITPQTVDCAEKIAGIEFHSAEEEAIARSLNQNLSTYQQLRQVEIPSDTPLAISFHPCLPDTRPKGPATPGRALRYSRPAVGAVTKPANLEDVAFWPVAKLAALIERRLVTSTALTKMYLERLKKHGPSLFTVVTLTEELALKEAAEADKAIAAGRYKGHCTAFPGARKTCLRRRGSEPRGAQSLTRIRSSITTRRSSNGCAMRALCSSRSSRWAHWRRAACGSAVRHATRGTSSRAPADRRRDQEPRPPPASWVSPSARKRAARSSRPRRPTAWSAFVRRMDGSAATARWNCRGRWTRSVRCAGTSRTACSS